MTAPQDIHSSWTIAAVKGKRLDLSSSSGASADKGHGAESSESLAAGRTRTAAIHWQNGIMAAFRPDDRSLLPSHGEINRGAGEFSEGFPPEPWTLEDAYKGRGGGGGRRMHKFADAATLTLVQHSRRDVTSGSGTASNLLHSGSRM